jgi:short-chain Z-isoprenyl diphosphate synthase
VLDASLARCGLLRADLDVVRRLVYRLYEWHLTRQIAHQPLPRHIAVILDGHRRFARATGMSVREGYALGAAKTDELLRWCTALDIRAVTLWLLSTENLERDADEVRTILAVIEDRISGWVRNGLASELGMQIRPIGRLDLLPPVALDVLQHAEEATRAHGRLRLNVAVGYGGREEIVDAVRAYLRDRTLWSVDAIVDDLTPDAVGKYLYTYDCPDPDLIIRTSGEVRLSGFMLWQSAHSEFYFCDVSWPQFRRTDFLRAIRSYQGRHRRFGR